jgi:tRNA (guanine-N7-)-methyltransferase
VSDTATPLAARRAVRSFVRREGRITPAQRRALVELLPRHGVAPGEGPIDPVALFGRTAPLHLEIGFGDGAALAAMVAAHPEHDYLGVEVHRPGVGAALRRIAAAGLTNVRVAPMDASELLPRLPDASLAAVYLFFPDPWPKKRHHKRRLVQPAFVAQLRRALAFGGRLYLATDWPDYAAHMLAVLTQAPGFENTAGTGGYAARPSERPLTKYEERGRRLGLAVRDLIFRRVV